MEENLSYQIKVSGNANNFNMGSLIEDKDYNQLLAHFNGGYFYKNTIHFWGVNNKLLFHDLEYMNKLLNEEYNDIAKNLLFIGEDIFGNLFCYEDGKGMIVFDIEDGSRVFLGDNFKELVDNITSDLDYYSGLQIIKDNISILEKLKEGKRLRPKIPFVLGGDFNVDSLIMINTIDNIRFCASIAKQIINLPDGTDFSLIVK